MFNGAPLCLRHANFELMSLPVSTARGRPKMILIKGKGSKERLVHFHHPLLMRWIDWLKFRDKKEDK